MTNPHFTDSNHLYLSDRETEAGVDCLRLTVSQSVCPGHHVGPLVSPGVSSVLPGIVFSWLTVVGRVVPAVQSVQSLQWRHASLLLSANIIMCWLFSYQVSHKTLTAPMTTDRLTMWSHSFIEQNYTECQLKLCGVPAVSCPVSYQLMSSYNPLLRGGLTWSPGSVTCPGLIRLVFRLISANIVSNCSGPSNCTQLRIVYDKQILKVYLNNISVEYLVLSKQQNVERTHCSNWF